MFSWLVVEKGLLRCSLEEHRIEAIKDRLMKLEGKEDEFSISEVYDILNEIRDNQFDPIVNGVNYNQSDIMNHLKKLR